MAGGIDWFRWHHGSVTDPVMRLVAHRSGVRLADIIAIWVVVLEHASAAKPRGSVKSLRSADVACFLNIDADAVEKALKQLEIKGLLSNGRVADIRRYFPAVTLRPAAHVWAKVRAIVFERDAYTCAYCGATVGPFECDHVVPVAEGGNHEPGNLVTACRKCNRSKGSKRLEAWRGA